MCLVLLIVPALFGLKRGLVMSVYKLLGIVLVLGLTFLINPLISKAVSNNESAYAFFNGIVTSNIKLPEADLSGGTEAVKSFNLPSVIEEQLLDAIEDGSTQLDSTMTDIETLIHDKLTNMLITGVCFIGTLLVSTLVVWIAFKALDLISKLKFLNFVNKFAGTLLGLLEGLLLVWTLCAIIPMISASALGQRLTADITSNGFLTFIYEHNLLTGLINR